MDIPSNPSTSRTLKLRRELWDAQPSICTERARLVTEADRLFAGVPPLMRRALTLDHILKNISLRVEKEELIVGSITSRKVGAILYPEYYACRLEPELKQLSQRELNPFQLEADQEKELREEIFPYWKNRNVQALCASYMPTVARQAWESVLPFILTEIAGIAHFNINYERVIKEGLQSTADQIKERIEFLEKKAGPKPGDLETLLFYRAAWKAIDAAMGLGRRYQVLLQELAERENDWHRKKELLELVQVFSQIPAGPARSFHEGLQCIWLLQLILHQENYEQGISPGRMDQYLYTLYHKDLQEGRLNREKALELVECLWIKMCEFAPCFEQATAMAFQGLPTNQAVTIGGVGERGEDASNELSLLLLEATGRLRVKQPNLSLRYHPNIDPELFGRACQTLLAGATMPSLFNDSVIMENYKNMGLEAEEARNYCVIGCAELAPSGNTLGSTDAALFNLGLCLELALNNGYSRLFGMQLGPSSGDPSNFKNMEEVLQAFQSQVAWLVRQMVAGLNAMGLVHKQFFPTPFASSLLDGCLEQGQDATAGGARYNWSGVQGVGIADVADSFTALEILVFRQKKMSMNEMVEALNNNFQDPLLEQQLLSLPKYGNDREIPDMYASTVMEVFAGEVEKYQNTRGGPYIAGFYSMTTHNVFGSMLGALPSGKKAHQSLADGVSPTPGNDQNGPTASLKSVSRLNYQVALNGSSCNQKFNPGFLSRGGREIVQALLQTYFQLGGMHLQLNCVSRETLLEAQENPEKHPGLLVRLTGYSAYFADLSKELQDEIIRRSEHVPA